MNNQLASSIQKSLGRSELHDGQTILVIGLADQGQTCTDSYIPLLNCPPVCTCVHTGACFGCAPPTGKWYFSSKLIPDPRCLFWQKTRNELQNSLTVLSHPVGFHALVLLKISCSVITRYASGDTCTMMVVASVTFNSLRLCSYICESCCMMTGVTHSVVR
jgi:hypothetical protein